MANNSAMIVPSAYPITVTNQVIGSLRKLGFQNGMCGEYLDASVAGFLLVIKSQRGSGRL